MNLYDIESELAALRAERDELRERNAELEAEVKRLKAELAAEQEYRDFSKRVRG